MGDDTDQVVPHIQRLIAGVEKFNKVIVVGIGIDKCRNKGIGSERFNQVMWFFFYQLHMVGSFYCVIFSGYFKGNGAVLER